MPKIQAHRLVALGVILILNFLATSIVIYREILQRGGYCKWNLSSTYHKFMSISKAFKGDDYPIELPLSSPPEFVAMTLQETVHYPFNISDPDSEKEWETLFTNPVGLGRVHLGPDNRVFTNVFWHQMHCIREMERAIQDRSHPVSTPKHIRHCLNYLRQHFICDADYTLEEGDFMARDFELQRSSDTRLCRDWEIVYQTLERRVRKWAAEQRRVMNLH